MSEEIIDQEARDMGEAADDLANKIEEVLAGNDTVVAQVALGMIVGSLFADCCDDHISEAVALFTRHVLNYRAHLRSEAGQAEAAASLRSSLN